MPDLKYADLEWTEIVPHKELVTFLNKRTGAMLAGTVGDDLVLRAHPVSKN